MHGWLAYDARARGPLVLPRQSLFATTYGVNVADMNDVTVNGAHSMDHVVTPVVADSERNAESTVEKPSAVCSPKLRNHHALEVDHICGNANVPKQQWFWLHLLASGQRHRDRSVSSAIYPIK
jgi:hypothetical protein